MICPKCLEAAWKTRAGWICSACGYEFGGTKGASIPPAVSVEDAPLETTEQQRVVAWCRKQGGDYAKIFAIPNGGKRTKREAARLVREGVIAGIPDLFLPVAGGDSVGLFNGLFVELKRLSGGTLSPEQEARIAELRQDGYRVEVCRGADEAIVAIARYLEGK